MTSPKSVLVVGGAGYIGNHRVWLLGQKGVDVMTLDNLSSGHRDAVLHGQFVHGDIAARLILEISLLIKLSCKNPYTIQQNS